MQLAIQIALTLASCGLLALAYKRVRETTLVSTWIWVIASLMANHAVEILAAANVLSEGPNLSALRYVARVLLVCPVVSLLGAKRPQAGPWNFIVISLWAILALPAAEMVVLNSGQSLEIHGARSWFLLILLFASLVNTLPTRHWLAAIVAHVGLYAMLARYLPGSSSIAETIEPMYFILVALFLYVRAPVRTSDSIPLNRLWLDFRDTFGLFWALRVQERLLDAAKMYEWPIVPMWTGWIHIDGTTWNGELAPEHAKSIDATLRGLLRRFVSNAWIDERTNAEPRSGEPPLASRSEASAAGP